MPVARPESSESRIIAHVDMDCFYVQVEQRKQPQLRGLPSAVVQYNEWKGGALIAVSYEARKFGIKRSMRGDEAKEVCPQIQLVQVPVARGKADLNTYRNAGSEVVSILARKGRCERASIDEVYLDLTESAEAILKGTPPDSLEVIDEEVLKSHVLGLKNEDGNDASENVRQWLCRRDADHRDKLLACGAIIVAELRMQVLKETEFTCSAGVAHNKMLAKLASGMNKPAQQTVVPSTSVKELLDALPIKKMKQLGGKLGSSLQSDLGVNTVGDLLQFSEEKLQDRFGINTGTWLWNIARGINGEQVQERLLPKSHGSGKSFPGPRALKTIASVQHWLNQLSEELSERLCSDLDQNKRMARILTLHANSYKSGDSDSHKKFPSKSGPLRYGTAKIQEDAFNLFQAGLREYLGAHGLSLQRSHHGGWGITALSISASKIVDLPSGTCSIMKYFHGKYPSYSPLKQTPDDFIQGRSPASPSGCESSQLQNEHKVTFLEQSEQTITAHKDEDSFCSSPKQVKDGFMPDTSLLVASGNESCLGLTPNNTEGCFSWDETRVIMPNSACTKQEINASIDKGTASIMKYFHGQDPFHSPSKQTLYNSIHVASSGCENSEMKMEYTFPCLDQPGEKITESKDQDLFCSSPKEGEGCSMLENSLLFPSGSESCSGQTQSNLEGCFSRNETRVKTRSFSHKEQKGTVLSDKGTILKFFKSCDRSSSSLSAIEKVDMAQGSEANPSELGKDSLLSEYMTNDIRHSSTRNVQQHESWNYNIDEIDPSVIDELPPEIQDEVRAWIRPHKRASIIKRGSTIAHYFLPTRTTQRNGK